MRILLLCSLLAACGTQSSAPTDANSDAGPTAKNKEAPVDLSAPADVEAAPSDAQTTASGLSWRVLKKGTGDRHPSASSEVEVHYTGWTTDGKMFDSSRTRGETTSFTLNRVIAGWTEGLQLMVAGETSRFWIPQELAYKGRSGAPAGMLVFDVELVNIVLGLNEKYPAPEDVAAAPEDAQKTASGLAYKILSKGKGTAHPGPETKVDVHYTGWQTDGTTFDSSHKRNSPATFPLNAVIPGWTEGVQLLSEGDKARFWIPSDLAYAGRPGRPQGMLVFDIELLKIH